MRRAFRRILDLGLGGAARARRDMDREIDAHLAMRAADLEAAGWSPAAAREEARRRFGDSTRVRRSLHRAAEQRERTARHRDRWGAIVADSVYAARQARRAPGHAALLIIMLAIGTAATTGMFTLVNGVVLRPLPYQHAEELLDVQGLDTLHRPSFSVSSADWTDWRRAPSLASSALYSFPFRQTIVVGDTSTRVTAETVSSEFFATLQPRFVVGRGFDPSAVADGARQVVISERLWRSAYGADPTLARPLVTSRSSLPIVGVIPNDQAYPAGTDVWIAVPITAATDPVRVNLNWQMIARRASSSSPERAAAELSSIARGIHASDPTASYDFGVIVQPLATLIVRNTGDELVLLFGVVAFVLLIVCANVAATGLSRSSARRGEMAVRIALGASRARIVQQLIVEHVLFALVGGLVGIVVAWTGVRIALTQWGAQIPRAADVHMDWRVFAFALAVSLLSGVIAGVLPALRTSAVAPGAAIASRGRTVARGGRNLPGASLVALEIALALVLLTGAGLLVRSFRSVLSRDIGFDTDVTTVEAALTSPVYAADTVRRYAYWDALVRAYRSIPGVQQVGLAQWIPLGMTGAGYVDIFAKPGVEATAVYRSVNEDFFAALGIPVARGRVFGADDGASTERVVVINRAMAKRYWPNDDPIGQRIRARSMERTGKADAPWLRVVGIVGDIRTYGLESDVRPEMYVYFRQTPWLSSGMTALVRTSRGIGAIDGALRRGARDIDSSVPVDIGTLSSRLHTSLAPRVLTLTLLTGFAAIALLLAALGIYGVLSYSVTRRTRELAVRAALGARTSDLLRLVVMSGLRTAAIGVAIGLVGAALLTRTRSAMLVGIGALDPVSFGVAVAVLGAATLAAMVIPARRACHLDPMIALQSE